MIPFSFLKKQCLNNLVSDDEEASIFAYRILYEIKEEVKDAAKESKIAENKLSEAEVHSIEVIAKIMEENSVNEEEMG